MVGNQFQFRSIQKRQKNRTWLDLRTLEYFLGMRVQQDMDIGTIQLTQRPYWELILNRFDLNYLTPRNTPLPVGIVLDSHMSPQTDSEKEMIDKPYQAVLGSVM